MNSEETSKETMSEQEKQVYNNGINRTISELQKQLNEYTDAKDVASSIKGANGSLIDSAGDADKLLEKIKINGEPVGKNIFKLEVLKKLTSYDEVFSSIISECTTKIEELENRINSLRAQLL